MMTNFIADYLSGVKTCLQEISESQVNEVVSSIMAAYRRRSRIFICGNGGSASTSTHFACDLAKGTIVSGKQRVRAISLTDNMALITAVANDIDYNAVFKEQLVNLLEKDDLVIAISASGNSPNVLEAVQYAKAQGVLTIGICGFGGGKLSKMADKAIVLSLKNYRQIEDAHMVLCHLITNEVQRIIESNAG